MNSGKAAGGRRRRVFWLVECEQVPFPTLGLFSPRDSPQADLVVPDTTFEDAIK